MVMYFTRSEEIRDYLQCRYRNFGAVALGGSCPNLPTRDIRFDRRPVFSPIAMAQSYPSRSVHLIVPAAPGGPTDIIGRLISQKRSDRPTQYSIYSDLR